MKRTQNVVCIREERALKFFGQVRLRFTVQPCEVRFEKVNLLSSTSTTGSLPPHVFPPANRFRGGNVTERS